MPVAISPEMEVKSLNCSSRILLCHSDVTLHLMSCVCASSDTVKIKVKIRDAVLLITGSPPDEIFCMLPGRQGPDGCFWILSGCTEVALSPPGLTAGISISSYVICGYATPSDCEPVTCTTSSDPHLIAPKESHPKGWLRRKAWRLCRTGPLSFCHLAVT